VFAAVVDIISYPLVFHFHDERAGQFWTFVETSIASLNCRPGRSTHPAAAGPEVRITARLRGAEAGAATDNSRGGVIAIGDEPGTLQWPARVL